MSDFPFDAWLAAWQSVQPTEEIGLSVKQLAKKWNVKEDAASDRLDILIEHGLAECTWARSPNRTGIIQLRPVYILRGESCLPTA